MKTVIVFALAIAAVFGQTANEQRYPNMKTAQQGRNFGNPVDNTDFNPEASLQNKRSPGRIHNVEIPGYNPYDPARNEPGYFPNYSNRHLDSLLGGIGGFGESNPVSGRPSYQSYSSHTGDVTVERRSTSNSRYNNQPAYTRTTDELIRYPGNQGSGITEAKTTFNYIPSARDITTRHESYPGGDVVITSNHPSGGNDRNPSSTNYQRPTSNYPSARPSSYPSARPTNSYSSPAPRYNSRNNGGDTPVYPSANPTVYTRNTVQSQTFEGKNGPGRVDSQTTFNYIPSNRDVTVARRPYNGGEVVVASNHPVSSYDAPSPTPRYNTRSRGNSGYQSTNGPSTSGYY